FFEVFFARRHQRLGELERRRAVDEGGGRGVAEGVERFLVGGGIGEGLAGFLQARQGRREAVADRDPAALGNDDDRLATQFRAADREPARAFADLGDPWRAGRTQEE